MLKKIIVGVPLIAALSLAAFIAWVNLAPEEDIVAEAEIEDSSNDKSAKEYIKIALDDWNTGGWVIEEYEKSLTSIALNSIDSREMAVLGVSEEFSELKKIEKEISGKFGRLSPEEQDVFNEKFRNKLEEIHTAIN